MLYPMVQGSPIDRYVVLEYLAEGGMGAIYLGKKLGAGGFEKQVVLKQLLPEFTKQQEFIELFLREARLSATLDHANIIHTIDLVTAGEEHFIVMEYLDGADLRSLLKKSKYRRQQLSAASAIYVAKEILSALAYAHNKIGPDGKDLKLIHRDISPSNILISANGEVKLTDFGIAKAATHNSIFYRVKGKVGYMSPEQARSETLDARSDLYSLAVCLYEMITGERLLVSSGITTSAEELYNSVSPMVTNKVLGLPPELDKVMLRALSIDPQHRYQSAGEFQEALLRCAHRHGLLMAAPELSVHLREVCGSPSNWRDSATPKVEATEVYDVQEEGSINSEQEISDEGTEQLTIDEQSNDLLASEDYLFDALPMRKERAKSSMSLLGNLQGIELTSLTHLADNSIEGAKPLVDLDDLGNHEDQFPVESQQSSPPPPTGLISTIENLEDPYAGVVIKKGHGRPPREYQPSYNQSADKLHKKSKPYKQKTSPPLYLLALIIILGFGCAFGIGLSGEELDESPPTKAEIDLIVSKTL